jgi:hypothetical protein
MKKPRILIYGPTKIGVSSYCAQIPNAYFIDLNGTVDHLKVQRNRCSTFDQLDTAISELKGDNHTHDVLVIDNLSGLERILINEVVAYETEKRTPGIEFFEEIPFGKGPGMVIEKLKTFLDDIESLNQKMTIIITAHQSLEERNLSFGIPLSYAKPSMVTKVTKAQKIVEDASDVLMQWADCVLYASHQNHVTGQYYGKEKYKTLNEDQPRRCIYTSGKPGFEAGNRYGLPYELPFVWRDLETHLNKYIEQSSNTIEEEQ